MITGIDYWHEKIKHSNEATVLDINFADSARIGLHYP